MKALMGNSCAKGCLFYVVALLVVMVATMVGLGGLKGRFANVDLQGAPPSGQQSSSQIILQDVTGAPGAALQKPPDSVLKGGGGGIVVPTPPPPLPTTPPVSAPTPLASQAFTPVPSQGGVISGEASQPFYVVQSGDSLWTIAQRFGVSIDALRAINHISGDTIYPGQIIYLPPGTQQSQQSQPPQGQQQQRLPQASVPDVPAGTGTATAVTPGMPGTGIARRP